MKKRLLAALLAMSMVFSVAACGAKEEKTEEPAKEEAADTKEEAPAEEADPDALELSTIHWAKDNSGNAFVAIALQQGWFDEIGLTIEEHPIDSNDDALVALTTGQIDILSNYGTNVPLQYISKGEDVQIIGGYMAQGCMPIICKKDTEWKGVESMVGKKVAAPANTYTVSGTLLDLGYDPLKDVEWLEYPTHSDRVAAVVAGEADYAVVGTSRNFEVSQNPDLKVVAYQSDLIPFYSCCRMCVTSEFLEANPNTVKAIIKVLLRAEAWYNSHKEETEELMIDYMGASKEYLDAYMPNEHFQISVDPLKKSVIRGWGYLKDMGYLDAAAENLNIEDFIHEDVYKEALDEAYAEYHDEDPAFWDGRLAFFEEYDS